MPYKSDHEYYNPYNENHCAGFIKYRPMIIRGTRLCMYIVRAIVDQGVHFEKVVDQRDQSNANGCAADLYKVFVAPHE